MTDRELLEMILQKVDTISTRLTSLELHLENKTDKNIQILAENHSNLIDKLNEAIPAVNKNLIYETKVSYLIDKVEKLEKEIEELKSRIA